jgi:precorrin-6A/cobalt-precorrin-6A reductase
MTIANILILGGTSEASKLVDLLTCHPEIKAILSLAGRTKNPVLPEIIPACTEGLGKEKELFPHRIGGFGGAKGLAAYIKEQKITTLICATHPFARKMPFNAQEAAKLTGTPLLYLLRPAWKREPGDNWIEMESHKKAVEYLNNAQILKTDARNLNIFLTVGRLEIGEYAAASRHHYIIRSIDEIREKLLKNAVYITARPPFSVEDEEILLKEHKIDYIISKNSGGKATEAKIIAARNLSIPIIMINRPLRPEGLHVEKAEEAMEWLQELYKTVE